jgi:hypothetical protein
LGGVAYLAYLNGIHPAQALFFANMVLGRRRRGGGFRRDGGWGGPAPGMMMGGVGGRNFHRGYRGGRGW